MNGCGEVWGDALWIWRKNKRRSNPRTHFAARKLEAFELTQSLLLRVSQCSGFPEISLTRQEPCLGTTSQPHKQAGLGITQLWGATPCPTTFTVPANPYEERFQLEIMHDIYTYIHTYIHTYLHYITLHYITLHYITLHYIHTYILTLHYITLHYITLHYITLHYIHTYIHTYITLHYITLHYITYIHTYTYTYTYT